VFFSFCVAFSVSCFILFSFAMLFCFASAATRDAIHN